MMIFKRKRKTPLGKDNIELGKYFAGYHYCSPLMISKADVIYVAERHQVHFRVVLPGGPTGFSVVSVPRNVRTLEDLLDLFRNSDGYSLKEESPPTKNH